MWVSEQTQRCNRCGTYEWQWADDASPYEGGLYKCWGCEKLDVQTDIIRKNDAAPHGMYAALYPVHEGEVSDG